MRVLLGEMEVAGYSKGLAAGLHNQGCIVYNLSNGTHQYYFDEDRYNGQPRIVREYTTTIRNLLNSKGVKKTFLKVKKNCFSFLVLFWSIFKCDAYIFNYGTTLLPFQLDLLILKILKKPTIVNIGFGSDSRPSFIDGTYCLSENSHLGAQENYERTKVIKAKIKRIENWAMYIISCVNNCHLLSRPFLNFTDIGIPIEIPSDNKNKYSEVIESDYLRILHAPSNSFAKGTNEIEQVIQKLVDTGFKVRYIKLQGIPNNEVIDHLRGCDLVIDQLYSDTPMATFATEASALGIPCIVGGIGWDQLNKYHNPNLVEATIQVHSDELESQLIELIDSRELLKQIGKRAQSFVKENWNSQTVAEYHLKILNDQISDDELVDPSTISYSYGLGMNEGLLKTTLKSLYKKYGEEGFVTKHRGQIEAFKELIGA